MPLYQSRLLFKNNVVPSGWSEVYYITAASALAAATDMNIIVGYRLPLSPLDVTMLELTVSDTDIKGDVYIRPGSSGVGSYAAVSNSLSPDTCLLCGFYSLTRLVARKYIHGIPTDQFTGAAYTPSGPYITVLNQYLAAVQAITVGVTKTRHAGPPVTFTYVTHNITNALILRPSNRKIGRPFFLPRGRRMIA